MTYLCFLFVLPFCPPPKFRLNESENEILERTILDLFLDIANDLWSIVKHEMASIALQEDWIKKLEKDNCLFQSALFWNKDFNLIKQKVSIELRGNDKDLDLDRYEYWRHSKSCCVIS